MVAESLVRYHEVANPAWLVSSVNQAGERGWFVRVTIGGLYPRRLGPFSSTDEALEFYEELLRQLLDLVVCDSDSPRVVIEDELAAAYFGLHQASQGQEVRA